jgi:hypothetical protein
MFNQLLLFRGNLLFIKIIVKYFSYCKVKTKEWYKFSILLKTVVFPAI